MGCTADELRRISPFASGKQQASEHSTLISQAVPPFRIIIINREAGYEANYRGPVNERLLIKSTVKYVPPPGFIESLRMGYKRFVLQAAKHVKLIHTQLDQPNQFNQPTDHSNQPIQPTKLTFTQPMYLLSPDLISVF